MTLQSTAAPPITPTSSLKERYVVPIKPHPVASGFGPAVTAIETLYGVDLTGTIAVVTGGYTGIGLETTRPLVGAGATVIAMRAWAGKDVILTMRSAFGLLARDFALLSSQTNSLTAGNPRFHNEQGIQKLRE
jgi:hypothetical protein